MIANFGGQKKMKIQWSFVIYLFCFIFAPPLIPVFNFVLVVFVYSVYKIATKYRGQLREVIQKSKIKVFLQMIFLAYFYILLITIVTLPFEHVNILNYIKIWYRFFLITPVVIVCVIYIILRCKELGYNLNNLIYSIILAGVMQAVISVLMLISPQIKSILVSILYMNSGDEITQNASAFLIRYFAFSNTVLDSFGYGVGIIAALPIYLAIREKTKYLWLVPLLLVVPLLNSRTGLIIFAIGVICIIPVFLGRVSTYKHLKIIMSVSVLIFVGIQGMKILEIFVPYTMYWVQNGLENMISVASGDSGGNESVSRLFADKFWYFPEGLQLIAGTGHNIYEAIGYSHSDVGYVNDLWLGGIIGITLLYFPIIWAFYFAARSFKDVTIRLLVVFLLVALLVVNIKGIIINYNVGIAVTLPIIFYAIYSKK